MAAPIDMVRLLIADVDTENPALTDDQVGGFLALHGASTSPTTSVPSWTVRRAAADALLTIAASEVLISKVIRSQDLTTDGAKVAAELRAQAAEQRRLAAVEEAEDEEAREIRSAVGTVEFEPWRMR